MLFAYEKALLISTYSTPVTETLFNGTFKGAMDFQEVFQTWNSVSEG